MKRATKRLIDLAKVKHTRQQSPLLPSAREERRVPDVDRMLTDRWYTFSEIANRFGVSDDKISRDFRGRDGVVKIGRTYRVSETAVRLWLAEALRAA